MKKTILLVVAIVLTACTSATSIPATAFPPMELSTATNTVVPTQTIQVITATVTPPQWQRYITPYFTEAWSWDDLEGYSYNPNRVAVTAPGQDVTLCVEAANAKVKIPHNGWIVWLIDEEGYEFTPCRDDTTYVEYNLGTITTLPAFIYAVQVGEIPVVGEYHDIHDSNLGFVGSTGFGFNVPLGNHYVACVKMKMPEETVSMTLISGGYGHLVAMSVDGIDGWMYIFEENDTTNIKAAELSCLNNIASWLSPAPVVKIETNTGQYVGRWFSRPVSP